MAYNDDHGTDGLAELEGRLRDARPVLSPLQLDAVQQRARARAGRTTNEGTTMKTRIAILATLVLGMLFSTAGAGLAVGGFGDEDQASVAQYGTAGPDEGDVLGVSEEAGGGGDVSAAAQTEFTTQGQEAGAGQLPFTGFEAIPVIVFGLALLGAGALMFRRTSGGSAG